MVNRWPHVRGSVRMFPVRYPLRDEPRRDDPSRRRVERGTVRTGTVEDEAENDVWFVLVDQIESIESITGYDAEGDVSYRFNN